MVGITVIKKKDCTCTADVCDRSGGCDYCLGLEADVPCPKDTP